MVWFLAKCCVNRIKGWLTYFFQPILTGIRDYCNSFNHALVSASCLGSWAKWLGFGRAVRLRRMRHRYQRVRAAWRKGRRFQDCTFFVETEAKRKCDRGVFGDKAGCGHGQSVVLSPFIEGVVGGNYVFAWSTPVLHFLNRTKMYLKYIAWLFKKKQLIWMDKTPPHCRLELAKQKKIKKHSPLCPSRCLRCET